MKATYKWVPIIFEDFCTGCGRCIESCTPRCLEMVGKIPSLTQPNICGSDEHCVHACPQGAIRMSWVPMTGCKDIGLWHKRDYCI